METATALSLNEAARVAGRGKSTIHKAIVSGRLSAKRGASGDWQIEPVELFRVFPVNTAQNQSQDRMETRVSTTGEQDATIFDVLVKEMDKQREQSAREIDRLSDVIQDLRERLNSSERERRELDQRLLSYQKKPSERVEPRQEHKNVKFSNRLVVLFVLLIVVSVVAYLYLIQ